MGCSPSKCLGVTPRKGYATPTEVAPMLPATVNENQEEFAVDNAAQDMRMDRGDGTHMDKSDDEEPAAEDDAELVSCKQKSEEVASSLDVNLVRVPEETAVSSPPSPPPRKTSQSADDIPISSTYHRVHSAVVAEQEAKWQEELRLEAEQREREVREYKAAMQTN